MAKNKLKQIPKELRDAIKMDSELKDTVCRFLTVEHYDFSRKIDTTDFERRVHSEFDNCNKQIKKVHNPEGGLRAIDREGVALKKRRQAVIDFAEFADRKFSSKYPELCIPNELLRLNCAPVGINFEYCEILDHTSVAAALWLLDRLQEEGVMNKAFAFFPELELSRMKVTKPPMEDTCHSDDVLFGMLYIIQHLAVEDDGTGMSPKQRFLEIMKLVDSCKVKRALRRYEEKQWENFDAVLCGVEYHRKKLAKLAEGALASINLCSAVHSEMLAMCKEVLSPVSTPIAPHSAFQLSTGTMDSSFSQYMTQRNKAERLGEREDMLISDVNSKLDEIENETLFHYYLKQVH